MKKLYYITFYLIIVLAFKPYYSLAKKNKAIQAINNFNFGLAVKYLEKYENKDIIDINYARALLSKQENTPYFDLKTAYFLINKVKKQYDSLNSSEKNKIENLGVDSIKIDIVRIEIEKIAYKNAKNENTIKALNNFINTYVYSSDLNFAKTTRNRKEFNVALASGLSTSMINFIKKRPNFEDINLAKKLAEDLEFYEQTSGGSVESYFYFIRNHKNNYNIEKALNDLYHKLIDENNFNFWEQYLVQTPKTFKLYDSAWLQLYLTYTKESTTETYIDFKYLYLGFPFQKRINLDIEKARQNFLPIREKGKWGFVSENNKFKISPRFDWVGKFVNNVFPGKIGDKIYLVNKSDRVLAKTEYDDIEKYNKDFFLVSKDDKFGIVDQMGLTILPPTYEEIYELSDSAVGYCIYGKCGFLDYCFDSLISNDYHDVGKFKNSLALVYDSSFKIGLINKKGKLLINPKYDYAEIMKYGLVKLKVGSKFDLFKYKDDSIYKISINEYDFIGKLNEERLFVAKNKKSGFLDTSGKVVVPIKYSFKESDLTNKYLNYNFHGGFAKVFNKTGYGFINKTGEKVVPFIYQDAVIANDSVVGLKKGTTWSYYDISKKSKIHNNFTHIKPFQKNLGIGKEGKILKVINREGIALIEEVWEDVELVASKYFIVKKFGKVGLADLNGNYLLPIIYSKIFLVTEKTLYIENNGLIGYYSLEEKQIIFQEKGL